MVFEWFLRRISRRARIEKKKTKMEVEKERRVGSFLFEGKKREKMRFRNIFLSCVFNFCDWLLKK